MSPRLLFAKAEHYYVSSNPKAVLAQNTYTDWVVVLYSSKAELAKAKVLRVALIMFISPQVKATNL